MLNQRSCKAPESQPQEQQQAKSSTTLEVKAKDSAEDPDLVIEQTYTANINGEKITVPVLPSGSLTEQKGIGTTATVTQEVDLTPIIKRLKPNWEAGIGIGYHKEMYVPLSLQRNYSQKKALSIELHLDPSDKMRVSGYEIQHKWFF